ncbi:hypothetical protein NUK55_21310, partial [Aeromonas veronii]|uniref:hypothetical protein n=1 Tax=Aeromonas veronii TaxID=654 RepID=UPI00214D774C
EWVHVQLHQQKGMISLSPPTICNSAFPDDAETAQNKLYVAITRARYSVGFIVPDNQAENLRFPVWNKK